MKDDFTYTYDSTIDDSPLTSYTINFPQPPNFTLTMGDSGSDVSINFRVKKTVKNRIKYWLFCKFFPFTITRWEDPTEVNHEN